MTRRGVRTYRVEQRRLHVDWPLGLAFAAVMLVLATFPPSAAVSAVACVALVVALVAEVRKRSR